MQLANTVLMVQPAAFQFNEETATNNLFQQKTAKAPDLQKIKEEFDLVVKTLEEAGVTVCIANDSLIPLKPDAIFPNNWISFNADSSIFIYPMYAANRRTEKRIEILDAFKDKFQIGTIHDFSYFEKDNLFLEGTGSMVFDHKNKIAYAALSERTNPIVLDTVIKKMGYQSICFTAFDTNQFPIYHTNVMLSIGSGYAIICLDSITNAIEKQKVLQSFTENKIAVIEITQQQVSHFCGNTLELINNKGEKILMLSQRAFQNFTNNQKTVLAQFAKLTPVPIDTIEIVGGGGIRCMLAEIFTPGIK